MKYAIKMSSDNTYGVGNTLKVSTLQMQLLTQRQYKDYLQLDRLCKKLENSEEEIPIFFKIRFFKIRILPLA